jgi:3-hydroxybutyryl-CoA dehydrogenase
LPTTVAIIGAGPLGRWLALSAARAGFRVLLEDVMPRNLHHAQEFLRQQIGPGQLAERLLKSDGFNVRAAGFSPYIKPDEFTAALAPEGGSSDGPSIAFVSTIEEAVREADLVIDCVPDELESKLEILWLLDRMAPPRTVLATPTTRLSIADLANCTYRPAKCIAIAAEASRLAGKPWGEVDKPETGTGKPETGSVEPETVTGKPETGAGNPEAVAGTPAAGAASSTASATPRILLRTTTRTAPETVALVRNFWRQLGFTPVFEVDPAGQPDKLTASS